MDGKAFGIPQMENSQWSNSSLEARLENCRGLTALHMAVKNRNVPLVRLLLYHGANPHAYWTEMNSHAKGTPALETVTCVGLAGSDGIIEAFDKLGSYTQDMDPCSLLALDTPRNGVKARRRTSYWLDVVCDAILQGDISHLKSLLSESRSMTIEERDQSDIRALMLATRRQQQDIIVLLLGHASNDFERLEPEHESFRDIDRRLEFYDNESAFEIAVKLHDLITCQSLIHLPVASLNAEQKLTRRRQLGTAYASAMREDDTQLTIMLARSDLDLDRIDEIMGPDYI